MSRETALVVRYKIKDESSLPLEEIFEYFNSVIMDRLEFTFDPLSRRYCVRMEGDLDPKSLLDDDLVAYYEDIRKKLADGHNIGEFCCTREEFKNWLNQSITPKEDTE